MGERVGLKVLLLYGDWAEIVIDGQEYADPSRVPAERITADTRLPREQLPGRRFTAEPDLTGFRAE